MDQHPTPRATANWRRYGLVAYVALAVVALRPASLAASPKPGPAWSELAAQAILASNGGAPAAKWDVETGLRLQALEAQWYNTANGAYFEYARRTVDAVLADPNWNAPGHSPYADALLGQQLMLLYRVTLKPNHYVAAQQLRDRLAPSCGLQAEQDAPQPMDAHEHCVAQAFLAEYASEFQRPQDFPALTRSFAVQAHRTNRTGLELDHETQDLLFVGYWAIASLADSLPWYPQDHPSRAQALSEIREFASAIFEPRREPGSSVHRPRKAASESPAANWMLEYALLKTARLGYLPASHRAHTMRDWRAILAAHVHSDSNGHIVFNTAQASLGAFLLASTEVDLASGSTAGHGSLVLLDAWFNSQQRKNAAGQLESFHYKWNDYGDSGYSLFGHMLRSRGLQTQTLSAAPTVENLRNASYYVIVSPDIPVKNPNPHYMRAADADAIAAWVHSGGILVLLENDPPNADIEHLNLLADRFGIHFDNVLHHHVLNDRVHGDHVEDGRIPVAGEGPLFHQPHTLYMKDTCAISLSGGATALLRDRGDVMMATARYGRGIVFANVDPWLYNEYTDGRNNPAIYSQFDNFAGGKEFVQWLIQQRPQSPAAARQEAHP